MSRALLLSVFLHEGRYNGAGDWPPAPARLFQALLAGYAISETVPAAGRDALRWLETLPPPVIATPFVRQTRGYTSYVPNNDLDAALAKKEHFGRIESAVAEIRVGKTIHPRLFDAGAPLLYLWCFDDGADARRHAAYVRDMADGLYQLGRGVDMAWARGELLDRREGERRLAEHRGVVHRPTSGAGTRLTCPRVGSLDSLIARHRETIRKFSPRYEPKPTKKDPMRRQVVGVIFAQPPKPRFDRVAYDCPPWRRLYEMRGNVPDGGANPAFVVHPGSDIAWLAEQARNLAACRLISALPARQAEIERLVIGRGAGERDKAARIRVVPLPSIGHEHVDRGIRRLLVEAPPDCPIGIDDIDWAFSGLDLGVDARAGEGQHGHGPRLLPAAGKDPMLKHYGIDGNGQRAWRSVTPAALPRAAGRASGHKSAPERLEEESRAAGAVIQALRHAGIAARPMSIRVQREPCDTKGTRAEAFASGRFSAPRLWHLEIVFAEPVCGPLLVGDGRYLGLGLMQPFNQAGPGILMFDLPPESPVGIADAGLLLDAARRALMALSRDRYGDAETLFSGHEPSGASARSGSHRHVFLAADDADGDGNVDRLAVAAPWICDRSYGASRNQASTRFEQVVLSLHRLRAGRLGVFDFGGPTAPMTGDPLIGPSRTWTSRTPYCPTRHASRGSDPETAIRDDVALECRRRGFPAPRVELLGFHIGPNGGNQSASLRLRFAVAVEGPLLLGRDSHRGGGLFAADDDRRPV